MADNELDFLKGFQLDDFDMDLGISFVDDNDESSAATAQAVESISTKVEGLGSLESKVNNIQSTLSGIKSLLDFDELNIEGKLDQILKIVEEAPTASSSDESANIAPETVDKIDKIIEIMGDPEARKAEVERRLEESIEAHKATVNEKLKELEKLTLPLLINLIKPESLAQKYIHWPNRKEIIERQIKRILQITRSE
jgi:uncharacterized protein YqgV (UPF0045/DUF77 family)